MKRKASLGILIVFYLISAVWACYIGRWETIYGVGAAVVLIIQASLFLFEIHGQENPASVSHAEYKQSSATHSIFSHPSSAQHIQNG